MSEWLVPWLATFGFTQAVELPIYWFALREHPRDLRTRERTPALSPPAVVAVAFGASAVTHPIVWFVGPKLPGEWLTRVLIAEVFAIAVEAGWLRAFGLKRALAWSAFANAASVLIATLTRAWFGWP